jgi:hypothetical protein
MCIPEIASHASIASVTPPVILSIISPALLWNENVQLSWISSFQIQMFMNVKIAICNKKKNLGCDSL